MADYSPARRIILWHHKITSLLHITVCIDLIIDWFDWLEVSEFCLSRADWPRTDWLLPPSLTRLPLHQKIPRAFFCFSFLFGITEIWRRASRSVENSSEPYLQNRTSTVPRTSSLAVHSRHRTVAYDGTIGTGTSTGRPLSPSSSEKGKRPFSGIQNPKWSSHINFKQPTTTIPVHRKTQQSKTYRSIPIQIQVQIHFFQEEPCPPTKNEHKLSALPTNRRCWRRSKTPRPSCWMSGRKKKSPSLEK